MRCSSYYDRDPLIAPEREREREREKERERERERGKPICEHPRGRMTKTAILNAAGEECGCAHSS